MGILSRAPRTNLRRHAAIKTSARGSDMETAIADLWDAGLSKEMIAHRLDISVETVNRVFGYLIETDESRLARNGMIAGSAKLARAILQARMAA